MHSSTHDEILIRNNRTQRNSVIGWEIVNCQKILMYMTCSKYACQNLPWKSGKRSQKQLCQYRATTQFLLRAYKHIMLMGNKIIPSSFPQLIASRGPNLKAYYFQVLLSAYQFQVHLSHSISTIPFGPSWLGEQRWTFGPLQIC